jgi:hypothetical protein
MHGIEAGATGAALVGFAVLSVVFFALIVWAGLRAARFQRQDRPFVLAFSQALSRHWRLSEVRAQLADGASLEGVLQLDDPGTVRTGAAALVRARSLGALQEAQQVRLVHYIFNLHSERGDFSFRGRFEHGEAHVRLRLLATDGRTRVRGVELSQTQYTGGSS